VNLVLKVVCTLELPEITFAYECFVLSFSFHYLALHLFIFTGQTFSLDILSSSQHVNVILMRVE